MHVYTVTREVQATNWVNHCTKEVMKNSNFGLFAKLREHLESDKCSYFPPLFVYKCSSYLIEPPLWQSLVKAFRAAQRTGWGDAVNYDPWHILE